MHFPLWRYRCNSAADINCNIEIESIKKRCNTKINCTLKENDFKSCRKQPRRVYVTFSCIPSKNLMIIQNFTHIQFDAKKVETLWQKQTKLMVTNKQVETLKQMKKIKQELTCILHSPKILHLTNIALHFQLRFPYIPDNLQ